jgi:hypothetical protein
MTKILTLYKTLYLIEIYTTCLVILPVLYYYSAVHWLARYDTRMQMDSTDPRVTDQHNYPKIVVMIEYNCTLLKGQLHYMISKTLAVINIIFVSLYGRRLLQNIAILY